MFFLNQSKRPFLNLILFSQFLLFELYLGKARNNLILQSLKRIFLVIAWTFNPLGHSLFCDIKVVFAVKHYGVFKWSQSNFNSLLDVRLVLWVQSILSNLSWSMCICKKKSKWKFVPQQFCNVQRVTPMVFKCFSETIEWLER